MTITDSFNDSPVVGKESWVVSVWEDGRMNFTLRSIGLAAFSATALTIAAVKGTNNTDPCAAGVQMIANECHFEKLVWDLVQDSPDGTDLESYLDMFPNSRFVDGAKERLSGLLPRYGVIAQASPDT